MSSEVKRVRKPYHRVSKVKRSAALLAAGKVTLFYSGTNIQEFHVGALEGVSGDHVVWHDTRKDLWSCTCEGYSTWNEKECTHILACKKLVKGDIDG